ncbi:MAG: Mur ligase family protein [Candidatus Andersenbacteria bacterium]
MQGIGGAGMRGLALLLAAQGHRIMGTDFDFDKITHDPSLQAYQLVPEHQAEDLLLQADAMIYSDAVPDTHPLRRLAANHNLAQATLFTAIGKFAQIFRTIAVAGTHGKSSTTAFIGHILTSAGLDPTVLVGAEVLAWKHNARVGKGEYFVVEADEYRQHFLSLQPEVLVITTVDFDHPDYFHSLMEVQASYAQLLMQVKPHGIVVTSQRVYEEQTSLPWPHDTLLVPPLHKLLPLTLPGKHMQDNAALALAVAQKLGIDTDVARAALASFPGLSRRFEKIGKIGSLQVISDYGHHPTEIAATIAAAREVYPKGRLLVLVEPHTTQRLSAFFTQFVTTLAAAPIEGLVICPTFCAPGREKESATSSRELYEALRHKRTPIWYAATYRAAVELMKTLAADFDVALAFSAGLLDTHLRQLKDHS